MRIIPIGFFAPNTGAIFVGALDPHASDLWSVFGLKRLLSSYTGPLIRIRRSSDNSEQDVGYLSSGLLDSPAALAFAGASSAYVVRTYDQSGNGNNFESTETAKQPRLVNSGVYDGSIIFDGVDDILTSVSSTPAVPALTFAGRYRLRSVSDTSKTQSIITHGNAATVGRNPMLYQHQGANNSNAAYVFEGSVYVTKDYPTPSTVENAEVLIGDRLLTNASKIELWRAGAKLTGTLGVTGGTTAGFTEEPVYVGGYPGGLQLAQMDAKWFAVWEVEKSASAAAISLAL
jgi:hypothetical protein